MEFIKRIIRPGTYSVPQKDGKSKRVYIGKKRIENWVDNFNRMLDTGLGVPAPWRHEPEAVPVRMTGDTQDVNAYNNAGFWRKLWVDDDGALCGKVDVPREEDSSKVSSTVVDVSLLARPQWTEGGGDQYDDVLTHIALVTHPVASDPDDNFEPVAQEEGTLAASLQEYLTLADTTGSAVDPEQGTQHTGVSASTATVRDALGLLAQMDPPIVLPDDTGPENFLERLVTAINAINAVESSDGADGSSISEPPPGARPKPGPIAMSKETDTKTDPKPEELKLSAEDQATINFARKVARDKFCERIENCVKRGKITPKMAKEQGTKLVEDLQLSFDADGNPVKTPGDLVLEAWEAIPDGSVLTGRTPTAARTEKGTIFGEEAFSLMGGVQEIESPDLTDPEDNMIMTEDDADEVVNLQLRQSGMTASRVEGGLGK